MGYYRLAQSSPGQLLNRWIRSVLYAHNIYQPLGQLDVEMSIVMIMYKYYISTIIYSRIY